MRRVMRVAAVYSSWEGCGLAQQEARWRLGLLLFA
jgi:hypothetical protein